MPIISPKIPSGLEELMRGLAKSVIKENPQNIYEFAAEYFENLLKERDGSCDQSYKKFATYKVYKKNKRLRREKESSNDVNDFHQDDSGFRKDEVSFRRDSSVEEFILPPAVAPPPLQALAKTSISFESGVNDSVKQQDDEGASVPSGHSEDDDIKNMVLDDDMEKAALKIQSSFRGHKVRREMKEPESTDNNITEQVDEKATSEPEGKSKHPTDSELDDIESRVVVSEGSAVENQSDVNVESDQEELIAADDTEPPPESSEVDDDIANMVLDDDMEQAALKIQASFRGHKVRKGIKPTDGPEATENLAAECAIVEMPEGESVAIERSGDSKANENESTDVENIGDAPEPLDNESEILSLEQSAPGDETTQLEEVVSEIEVAEDSNSLVNEEVVVAQASRDSLAEPESEQVSALEAEAENIENEATATDNEKVNEEIVEPEVESVIEPATESTVKEAVEPELLSVAQQEVESVLEEAIERVDGEALESSEAEAAIDEDASNQEGERAECDEVPMPTDEEAIINESSSVQEAERATNDEVSLQDDTKVEAVVEEMKSLQSVDKDSEVIETNESLKSVEAEVVESTEVLSSVDREGVVDEQSNNGESTAATDIVEDATEISSVQGEDQTEDEALIATGEVSFSEDLNEPLREVTSVESATDKVSEVENVPEGHESAEDENSSATEPEKSSQIDERGNNEDEIISSEVISDEVVSETQQKAEEIEQDLPEGEDLSPEEGASIENAEKLEKEPSVVDEAPENSENLIESENFIESNDNATGFVECEAVNENQSLEEKPQVEETIEVVETGTENVELNEEEPQEGLVELPPNESETENSGAEYADAIPVVEEICEKKFIEQLEPDQEIVESEIDGNVLGRDSLNQIEGDQENLEESRADVNDNLEKLPSGEIEYSTLKESMSEHDGGSATGSMDEADNKSRELTDEKSIDGDSAGSRQESLDDIQDEVIEQAEEKGSKAALSSTVDEIEINDTQQAAQLELHSNEAATTETVESILHSDISPIELMDEVVNEYAGAVASELFSGETEHLGGEESNLKEIEASQSSEHVEPKLSVENPLEEIEKPKSIDLTQESVQLSNEEIEPIIDEILQPETEESEIPEESPSDETENIPTVSMEEKSPSLEKDEPLPDDDNEESSERKPEDDDVSDMVLDEEMEDAALKIQAAFRGHRVRKETIVEQTKEDSQENVEESVTVVIDQCSEQTEDTQEQEETEQQNTSADVEEIQESEAVDEEETNEERCEEDDNVEEETAVEDETTEQAEDDPEGAPEEGETSEQQTNNNDDDDVANMVLDDEMENAALKIQATFRGHKTRKDIKKDEPQGESSTADEPQETRDPVQEVDDEIANMVLDEDMENAALKIQATFRGHKTRKDIKKEGDDEEPEKETDEAEEKKEDEPEKPKEEEPPAASSTEKTAKQLQDEEDIANIVMDAEMEQTAKKIQSVFRRKKGPKDSNESTASSAGDQTDDEEEPDTQDDDPFKPNESQERADRSYDDEKGSEHSTAHYSSLDDGKYSLERHETSYENEPMALNSTIEDLNLMQGGGIFPEPSGSSSDMLTGSSGEDRNPDRNSSDEKVPSTESNESEEPISQQRKSLESLDDDEKVIESFDFVANKDTAEAMYYSLKKNEIETQKRLSSEKQLSAERQAETEDELATSMETMTNLENQSIDEDDDDVVIGQPPAPIAKRLKYGMSMDDRLLGSILSQDYSTKVRKDGYPDDGFDPLLEATMRNHNFMEKLHEMSYSEDDKSPAYDDYPGDDEDQFDNFYDSKSIRAKIMASSFSIGDSDYFDPNLNKSIIDDDKIRTALETIHSTDSESTIASAATRIHAGERAIGKRGTTHSMQYSSIGNAAIDHSLDEFIQSQELRIERFDEELEDYSSPPPRKQESVDEWTDDTTTYTDSDRKVAGAGGVIEIKLEQKTSFLTVDERRRTLHREDAIQRNSTREDEDSSKSSNVSGEKLLDRESIAVETVVASVTAQDSVIDTEIAVPVLDLTAKPKSTTSQAKPQRMKRQHTMPVQIQTDVIRVIPKHLRKRIKSADGDKKKRGSK